MQFLRAEHIANGCAKCLAHQALTFAFLVDLVTQPTGTERAAKDLRETDGADQSRRRRFLPDPESRAVAQGKTVGDYRNLRLPVGFGVHAGRLRRPPGGEVSAIAFEKNLRLTRLIGGRQGKYQPLGLESGR